MVAVADTHPEDDELVARWSAGDHDAGNRLARRYYPNVRRFFDIRIPELAEDLTQRTFLACAENLASYRGDAGFKAYLFGVARLQLLRHLRHRQVRESFARKSWGDTPLRRTSISMIVAKQQEHHLLLLAYAKLPIEQQLVLELYYWEDMNSTAISAALDIPISTVTTRLSRARIALKNAVVEVSSPGAVRERVMADIDGWTRSLLNR